MNESLLILAQDGALNRAGNVIVVILAIVAGLALMAGVLMLGMWILENGEVIGAGLAGLGLLGAIAGYIAGAATWFVVVSIAALVVGGLLFMSEM